jgi:hypothetical protein
MALSNSIDLSTQKCYGSACNAYLSFIRAHNFLVEPSADTLSFFIVYMSQHISVATYLSGLVTQLEPFYPAIREAHHSRLVKRTLQGRLKLHARPTSRKQALSRSDVDHVLAHYASSTHDDLLFLSVFLTS